MRRLATSDRRLVTAAECVYSTWQFNPFTRRRNRWPADSATLRQFAGIDLGAEPVPRRNHGVQIPAPAGRAQLGRRNSGHGEPAPASERGTNHDGHDRRCDLDSLALLHQKPRAEPGSGDAPGEERQAVVFRDEGSQVAPLIFSAERPTSSRLHIGKS
jgi:hypothetical protein